MEARTMSMSSGSASASASVSATAASRWKDVCERYYLNPLSSVVVEVRAEADVLLDFDDIDSNSNRDGGKSSSSSGENRARGKGGGGDDGDGDGDGSAAANKYQSVFKDLEALSIVSTLMDGTPATHANVHDTHVKLTFAVAQSVLNSYERYKSVRPLDHMAVSNGNGNGTNEEIPSLPRDVAAVLESVELLPPLSDADASAAERDRLRRADELEFRDDEQLAAYEKIKNAARRYAMFYCITISYSIL